MSFKFNVFTSNFDIVDSGSSFWADPVANKTALDAITTDVDGTVRLTKDTNFVWRWNLGGSAWVFIGTIAPQAFGSAPNANGITIGSTNQITLQPADATHPGGLTASSQTIGGVKTFGSSVYADGGIDTSSAATLSIGTTNANVINIGNAGGTVNIQGTVITENTTTLNVTNPVFTLNSGGAAGSGASSGMQISENSIITGYAETSADRNSWELKAPNTAGIATITPGAGGITLNQTSHDPVTLTAVGSSPNGNAASLSTQALTLQPADGSNPGVLTAGTQTIGGAKTFSSAITGSLTGAASLNVLKAGDTMTGPLNMPSGSASTAEITGGTANTGIFFPTSSTTAFTSSGTESMRIGSQAVSVNTTTLGAPLTVKATGDGVGQTFDIVSSSGAMTYSVLARDNGSFFLFDGSNIFTSFFGSYAGTGPVSPTYKWDVNGGNGGTDILTPGFNPVIASHNINATDNNFSVFANVNSAAVIDSYMIGVHENHDGSVQTGHLSFVTANAGTNAEGLRITSSQQIRFPAYTTPGILTNDGSGNVITITNPASTGDINETTFSAANNQAVAANVTGLAFANGSVRAFEAIVCVNISATSSLYEMYTLNGVQRGSDWMLSQTSVGDASLITFSITTAGQIQYVTPTYTGFSSATLKFRAWAL